MAGGGSPPGPAPGRNPSRQADEGNIPPARARPTHVELSRDPDQALIEACQRPESDAFEPAFEALYHKYRDRVYSIAYRITGRAVDAMDVVQECFSLLFRRIETFRFDAMFSTWLFRIVVNCSIDQVRRQRSWSGEQVAGGLANIEDLRSEPVDQDPGPEETAEANELGNHVQASIQKMSPKLRAILVLRYLEGMTYEELAGTLSLSMGTVKSRLARAHIAMERVLSRGLDAFGFHAGDVQPMAETHRSAETHPSARASSGGETGEGVA